MTSGFASTGSKAEDLFVDLFCDVFGAEKADYLYPQYHFYDIYNDSRYADFLLENGGKRIAIEIDDETSHNKNVISDNKFYDDLLRQNSIFAKGGYTDKEAEKNILNNPFRRFEDMGMLLHTKTIGIIKFDNIVWKNLSDDDKLEIGTVCNKKLDEYFMIK